MLAQDVTKGSGKRSPEAAWECGETAGTGAAGTIGKKTPVGRRPAGPKVAFLSKPMASTAPYLTDKEDIGAVAEDSTVLGRRTSGVRLFEQAAGIDDSRMRSSRSEGRGGLPKFSRRTRRTERGRSVRKRSQKELFMTHTERYDPR